MKRSKVYSIINKNEFELTVLVKGVPFIQFLFYFCISIFLGITYETFTFHTKYSNQFKFPFQILAYFLIGISLLIVLKMIYVFFFQAFDFYYVFQKSNLGKIFYSLRKGSLTISSKELPDPVDFLDFQVRSFGMFGFQIFAFGLPSKENILKGNFLVRFSNIILQSPLIRVEFRYNSPTETKVESRALLLEIRNFIRKRFTEKPQKNPLMKLGITVEEVKEWVKTGVDVNERDNIIGNPVLFYAAGTDPEIPPCEWQEPNYPVIAELIRLGADVNSCNLYNERVLDYILRVTAQTGENASIQRLKSFLESYGYRK